MEVRAGRVAGRADPPQDRCGGDAVADVHVDLREVRVPRRDAVGLNAGVVPVVVLWIGRILPLRVGAVAEIILGADPLGAFEDRRIASGIGARARIQPIPRLRPGAR